MSEPNEKKYKQLALFSVIIAEVVITPSVCGGIVYWLLKGHHFQFTLSIIAALGGLVIAFYRIFKIYRVDEENQKNG